MPDTTIDEGFLEERLETMWRCVEEGVRREVDRLRELNLPIYVAENGDVVDLNERGRRE